MFSLSPLRLSGKVLPRRPCWQEQTVAAAACPGRQAQMVAHMLGDYLECGYFSANEFTDLTVGMGPWQSKGPLESKVLLDLRGHQNPITS